ncbi:MAG: carbohydrate binding family 9 domain-containing protein, partial [Bacteroidetes bacterium]|nr:carbohydrate binding family 9 domain-containing protein [Bacteroidota bacterium]
MRQPNRYLAIVTLPVVLWVVIALSPDCALSHDSVNPEKYHIKAVRIERDIALTGKLSDPLWDTAVPVEVNCEIQPGDNVRAPQNAEAYVLYNSSYIYFGFRCHDSEAKSIRSHVTERDKMTDDDFAGVILDTYGNAQSAYEFLSNPFGVQFDAMRTGNNEDPSFDCIWYSAGNITDSGYTLEIAVPFKSLRFASAGPQHWRVEFFRNLPRDTRYQITWTTLDRNNPCLMCQGGTIDGIENVTASDNVDIMPYLVGAQTGTMSDASDPSSNFTAGPATGKAGVGVKYAPSSSFALGAVVNPDFSQIESDATQISVNSTFSIFYAEKRPFFLEGADLFSTLATAFYSRMINNPLVAAKTTEKTGKFSLAYLVAYDRESPFMIPGEEGSDFIATSLRSVSNVVRTKLDFGSESFIGGMFTSRNFTSAHNYVGGVDWSFLFGGNYYFIGQTLLTDTREINDTSIFSSDRRFGSTGYDAAFNGQAYSGWGMQVDLKRNARDYSFDLSITGATPTFQAQDGFITSNDFRNVSFWHGYEFYFDKSFVENVMIQTNTGVGFNCDRARKGEWGSIQAQAQMKGQTYIWAAYYPLQEEFFHNVQFHHLYRTEVSANTNPLSFIAANIWVQVGRLIYRQDNPELGRGYNLSGELTLKPTNKFTFDVTCACSRLWSFYTSQLFYDGYIARTSVVYQFSPQLFVRLISQYDKFSRAFEVDPMLSYKLNPYTEFYAGSSHNFTDFEQPYGMERTAQQ